MMIKLTNYSTRGLCTDKLVQDVLFINSNRKYPVIRMVNLPLYNQIIGINQRLGLFVNIVNKFLNSCSFVRL